MQTNIEREISHALVISPDEVTAISKLISENYGAASFTALCSEGSRFKAKELSEMLGYENPNFRRIESFGIHFGSSLADEQCSVNFARRSSRTCSISISDHNDGRALKVADELQKRLRDCRPGYSLFTRVSPSTMSFALIFAFAVGLLWWQAIKTHTLATKSDVPLINLMFFLLPVIVTGVAMVGFADRFWRWLFPALWFCIGRQSQEFERRATVRRFVFIGIGLTIILGITANLLTGLIVKH